MLGLLGSGGGGAAHPLPPPPAANPGPEGPKIRYKSGGRGRTVKHRMGEKYVMLYRYRWGLKMTNVSDKRKKVVTVKYRMGEKHVTLYRYRL